MVKKIGSVVYRIQHLQNPRKRLVVHSNRLKNAVLRERMSVQEENWVILPSQEETRQQETVSPLPTAREEISSEHGVENESEPTRSSAPPQPSPNQPALRRSTRSRSPPDRYGTVDSFRDSDSEFEI